MSKGKFNIRCDRLRKEFKRNGLKHHPSSYQNIHFPGLGDI